MAYNTIVIQFDESTPVADLQNYNRRHYVGSIERDRTEFLPTPTEIATRKFLDDNHVYALNPHYLLNLVGDSPRDWLKWRLENPVYPLHYRFDCVFWANTSPEDKAKAILNIRKFEHIEKVQA